MTAYKSAFKPFAIAAACTVMLVASAFWIPNSAIAATMAIAAIFLGLPLSILLYRDGLRAVHTEFGATTGSVIPTIPIRALGGMSLVIGIAILGWLAYNVFVERQRQFIEPRTYGQVLLPFMLIVFGYHLMRRPIE